ncbi:MAG: hypothetical protein ACR2O0_01960, partial [Rhizobiaceae bacterium]
MNLALSRQLLISTSLSALVIALPVCAIADDVVINGNNPATVTLDGNDTLTVTPGGSIAPPSENIGVNSTGGNNKITNAGLIKTLGGNADGIFNNISPNSPITNSGMIHTGGNSSFGIYNDRSDDSPV